MSSSRMLRFHTKEYKTRTIAMYMTQACQADQRPIASAETKGMPTDTNDRIENVHCASNQYRWGGSNKAPWLKRDHQSLEWRRLKIRADRFWFGELSSVLESCAVLNNSKERSQPI